jgi:hypothetical protein
VAVTLEEVGKSKRRINVAQPLASPATLISASERCRFGLVDRHIAQNSNTQKGSNAAPSREFTYARRIDWNRWRSRYCSWYRFLCLSSLSKACRTAAFSVGVPCGDWAYGVSDADPRTSTRFARGSEDTAVAARFTGDLKQKLVIDGNSNARTYVRTCESMTN